MAEGQGARLTTEQIEAIRMRAATWILPEDWRHWVWDEWVDALLADRDALAAENARLVAALGRIIDCVEEVAAPHAHRLPAEEMVALASVAYLARVALERADGGA